MSEHGDQPDQGEHGKHGERRAQAENAERREPDAVRPHEDTGLDLARSIARSLATGGRSLRRAPSAPGSSFAGRGRRRSAEPQLSGAHPDDRDPQTLDATIGRLVAQQGWSTEVRVHGVFSRWAAVVGPEVALHATPESFSADAPGKGGRLTVRTDSTAWATQMRLLAATLVRRLNEELGDGTVAVIDVLGPAAPSWKKGRRSVRGGRGPRDTYG